MGIEISKLFLPDGFILKAMIYFDYNATAPLLPEVRKKIKETLDVYGNPSNIYYQPGREAQELVTEAREQLADFLGARPEEIIFTSGATEANNLAITGLINYAIKVEGKKPESLHVITSQIEHPAVYRVFKEWEKSGVRVTYIPANSKGIIKVKELQQTLQPQTILVSIMLANNVMGSIQPIKEMARLAHNHGVVFHTDAVQALGKTLVDFPSLGVDMLSISGHKIGALKGVGALYVRSGVRIKPLMHGGTQEAGLRPGTENLLGIISLSEAIRVLNPSRLKSRISKFCSLRERLIKGVTGKVTGIRIIGQGKNFLPNTVAVVIKGVEGESVVMGLNLMGICVSGGSACEAREHKISHILEAIGMSRELAQATIRISFGEENTKAEVDRFLRVFPSVVEQCRAL